MVLGLQTLFDKKVLYSAKTAEKTVPQSIQKIIEAHKMICEIESDLMAKINERDHATPVKDSHYVRRLTDAHSIHNIIVNELLFFVVSENSAILDSVLGRIQH